MIGFNKLSMKNGNIPHDRTDKLTHNLGKKQV